MGRAARPVRGFAAGGLASAERRGESTVTRDTALLDRLAWALADEPATNEVTWRVCQVVQDMLDADGASLTAETSTPHRVTLCTTGRRADALENLQDVLGEGPGMDAFDSGQLIRTGLDAAAAVRWPRFIPAAARIIGGDGLLWSVPMRSGAQPIGVIALYRLRPSPAGEAARDAQFLADLAASSLTRDPAAYRTVTERGCDDCWSSRAVVHQATGMLIGQLRVTGGEALARLRQYALRTGRPLTDVAADVLAHRLDLGTRSTGGRPWGGRLPA
jgi:hypothetical protein